MNGEKETSALKDDTGGEGPGKDHFSEVKVKMVMRIYGVSRGEALEIIAKRNAESTAAHDEVDEDDDDDEDDDEPFPFISAKEFFSGK